MSVIDAARKWYQYWNKRAQQGRDYVSKCGRNTFQQYERISPLIHHYLGMYHLGLDYGCGWGRFTPDLAEHCESILACDIVDTFRGEYPAKVRFQRLDPVPKIDLPDSAVDLLFCCLVLQHIVDVPLWKHVTAEINRVLSPTATVFLVEDSGRKVSHVQPRSGEVLAKAFHLVDYLVVPFDLDSKASHKLVIGQRKVST